MVAACDFAQALFVWQFVVIRQRREVYNSSLPDEPFRDARDRRDLGLDPDALEQEFEAYQEQCRRFAAKRVLQASGSAA